MESKSKEGILNELFFELGSIIEAAGLIDEIYRREANTGESVINFLNNYDFVTNQAIEIITDEGQRDHRHLSNDFGSKDLLNLKPCKIYIKGWEKCLKLRTKA